MAEMAAPQPPGWKRFLPSFRRQPPHESSGLQKEAAVTTPETVQTERDLPLDEGVFARHIQEGEEAAALAGVRAELAQVQEGRKIASVEDLQAAVEVNRNRQFEDEVTRRKIEEEVGPRPDNPGKIKEWSERRNNLLYERTVSELSADDFLNGCGFVSREDRERVIEYFHADNNVVSFQHVLGRMNDAYPNLRLYLFAQYYANEQGDFHSEGVITYFLGDLQEAFAYMTHQYKNPRPVLAMVPLSGIYSLYVAEEINILPDEKNINNGIIINGAGVDKLKPLVRKVPQTAQEREAIVADFYKPKATIIP